MNDHVIDSGMSERGRQSLLVFAFCLLPLAFLLSGCRQDMHDNPRLEAYEDGANRQLPAGTVARGSLDLAVAAPKVQRPLPGQVLPPTEDGDKGPVPLGEDGYPFKLSDDPATRKKEIREILDRGENRFNITCMPCHGRLGDGNGMVALRGFRHPPTYHQTRLRLAPTSHFYDVMTNGYGAMPSYTDQLTPEDRWKVIAYIRALQQSQNTPEAELGADEKTKVEESAKAPSPAQHAAGGKTN